MDRILRRTAPLILVLLVAGMAPALAADASDVASELVDTGFYVDQGANLDRATASRLVAEARNAGSRFHLVVLDEEPAGGPTTFGEAVFDRLGVFDGSIVVLTPDSVGWVTEDDVFSDADFRRAFDAANEAGGDDARYLTAFVSALTGTSITPEPSGTTTSPGGGGGFVWFLVIVVLLAGGVWWMVRRSRNAAAQRDQARIEAARSEVQKQIDAVANDILEMAEEVRLASNPEADRYYEAASATYTEVSDAFENAVDPAALIRLSDRLDEAIWQLDAAEAVLDGNPVPPKPVKEAAPVEAPAPTSRRPAPAPRTSYPEYRRRSSRRSSYVGPGLMDILIGVGSVIASTSGGRSRRRSRSGGGLLGGGGLFGGSQGRSSGSARSPRPSRSRSSGRSRSTGRKRGGGRRRR